MFSFRCPKDVAKNDSKPKSIPIALPNGIGYRLKPIALENSSTGGVKSHTKAKPQTSPAQQQTLMAIAGVWHRFKGRIEEQVALLEQAAAAVGVQQFCTPKHQELLVSAQREAHTLAGSLGTFGFAQGSQLARKIEYLLKNSLTDSVDLTTEQKTDFQSCVKLLRQEIQHSPPSEVVEQQHCTPKEEQPLLLIVDSDLVITKQLQQAVATSELQVSIATNLADARIQLYQQHPSVVLLDPSVSSDWAESLSFITELQQRKPPVPVIVFSEAHDFTNRLEVARHGSHTFLRKPIPPQQVIETVLQVLQQTDQGEAKVLAVDDDPKILALLQSLLRPWGLKVTVLTDPRQFWETLADVQPDLLILDVEMPEINGIELCKIVRGEPRWSELPIVFLTVHDDADIVNQVFAAGADDFVSKPIVGPELAVRIINRLERMKLLRHMTTTHRSQISERDNRWRAIFDAEPQCVKLIASDGTLLEINPAGRAMLAAKDSEELIGKSVYSFIAPEYHSSFRQMMERVCQGNKEVREWEIINYQGNRRWMETHSVPLKNEADHSCVLLAITRDIQDRKQSEKSLQTHIEQQAIVAHLGQVALLGEDIDNLMNKAVVLVAQNLEVDYCKLLELMPDGKTMLLRAGVGWDEALIGQRKVSLDDSQAGYTLLVNQPVIVEDMQTDTRFRGSDLLQSYGVTSGVSVPISSTNGIYGVLGAHTQRKQAFTQDDIHFLQAVANVLSSAMERQRTDKSLRKSKDELELRVAERTGELIKINEQLQSELNERQRAEEALRISQARFAGIVSIADDAIISIDNNQRITLFNQGAERIFGYSAQEAIGEPLDLIIPWRYIKTHRQLVANFGSSPSHSRRMGERREIYGRRKDGTEFPAEASISKLDLGEEKVYTVFLQDITERKQVDKMKDEFVSVVSHELRTPLTSIHGSLGMLASGLLPPESEQGKRLLQIAVDSTERLVRLINDILDIERIESGKVKMEKQPCLIGEIIQETVDIMQPLATKAGITLTVGCESVKQISTLADSDRIVQTLTNLLSNAIKFSPRGNTVWLSAEIAKQDKEGTRETEVGETHPSLMPHTDAILFTVTDHGRGIPADKLDSIFERFQQVDSSDSRNHDGTGLGLAICRSIVQQHGGRIWVDSVLGKGSNFYFTLPIIPQISNADISNPNRETSPLVLVCDDDPTIHTELQILLQKHGLRVVTVDSGEAAINQAVALKPDVILLDLIMPGMNGWETMAVLKQRSDTRDIPIVICSVCQPTETNQERTDFVDWVSKPVDESSLFQSLRQVLAGGRVRVLVIENDDDLAEVLIHLFEQHDIETFHAKTGREAIHLSQEVNPDLLVLNLILPEVDGFAVVEWLQQHHRLCSTPLVVYSAKDLDESERQRLKLGHTEFLSKGLVTTEEFEHRVMQLLHCMTRTRD